MLGSFISTIFAALISIRFGLPDRRSSALQFEELVELGADDRQFDAFSG